MSETLFSDCNFVGVKLITHKKKGTLIMKRTLYLLTAALLVVFASCVFIGCNKDKETIVDNNEQAIMSLPQGEEAIARILNFRNQVEAYKKNPAVKSAETISLAEAIWNIENLFNLTYAKPEDIYSATSEFVFSLYLPIDAQGNVFESDLCYLYEQVKALARTNYANLDFADKGFLFMTVELGEQIEGFARIDFRGKAGERCAQNIVNVNSYDSAMYIGPFRREDYWDYKRGNGKCDGSYAHSGADDQLEIHLQEYISSLLRVSDAGCRSVYLNRINISFDGRSAPSYAFYRTNVDATCIDFNNMNYYYGRERKYIVDILPNDPSAQIYGYVPVEIHIEGIELDTPSAITHQNRVTYTQRFVANISVVGETQDLLND